MAVQDHLSFENKIVVVTGGSRGIGLEVSKAFAKAKAKIIIVYRTNDIKAQEALESLPGANHLATQCDVSDAGQVSMLFDQVKATYGQVDIVVNNAGMGYHHPVDKSSYEDWQQGWHTIIGTNLIGPSNVCYQAAQMMIRQGSGKIINVSSRGAFRGEPEQPAYGASKAGLNSLTQSLAQRLAPYGIFVGAVAPGFVETEMAHDRLQGIPGDQIKSQSPMNRVAQPAEVAQSVLLMAAANDWMTGGIWDINGASYLRT